MLRKIMLGGMSLAFAAAVGVGFVATAHANKVDCAKVMSEVSAGKKTADIAKDQNISTSSVYRCKKKASGTKSSAKTSSAASPAMAASPASHR